MPTNSPHTLENNPIQIHLLIWQKVLCEKIIADESKLNAEKKQLLIQLSDLEKEAEIEFGKPFHKAVDLFEFHQQQLIRINSNLDYSIRGTELKPVYQVIEDFSKNTIFAEIHRPNEYISLKKRQEAKEHAETLIVQTYEDMRCFPKIVAVKEEARQLISAKIKEYKEKFSQLSQKKSLCEKSLALSQQAQNFIKKLQDWDSSISPPEEKLEQAKVLLLELEKSYPLELNQVNLDLSRMRLASEVKNENALEALRLNLRHSLIFSHENLMKDPTIIFSGCFI